MFKKIVAPVLVVAGMSLPASGAGIMDVEEFADIETSVNSKNHDLLAQYLPAVRLYNDPETPELPDNHLFDTCGEKIVRDFAPAKAQFQRDIETIDGRTLTVFSNMTDAKTRTMTGPLVAFDRVKEGVGSLQVSFVDIRTPLDNISKIRPHDARAKIEFDRKDLYSGGKIITASGRKTPDAFRRAVEEKSKTMANAFVTCLGEEQQKENRSNTPFSGDDEQTLAMKGP